MMNDQSAKADGGKLRLTLVPMEMVEAAAKIKEYEKQADNRLAPKMICKTRKKKGSWYGLFKCPYCGEKFEASVSNYLICLRPCRHWEKPTGSSRRCRPWTQSRWSDAGTASDFARITKYEDGVPFRGRCG